ncbi:hypothetical protein NFI96_015640 [Prochilodus magdalenae]|nr:hypothetical protein NFI96_015640 [Prochilodus magdalenae]
MTLSSSGNLSQGIAKLSTQSILGLWQLLEEAEDELLGESEGKNAVFYVVILHHITVNLTDIFYSVPMLTKTAGELAGQMALRLVLDHLLRLNVETYTNITLRNVALLNRVQSSGRVPKTLKMEWLMSALGSYSRASKKLNSIIQNSDLEDVEQCRITNNRIMGVERNFLSPYVSSRESPFRHILLAPGSHALRSHLTLIKEGLTGADIDLLRNQFALTTWTIH